jgi:hypothetical protein
MTIRLGPSGMCPAGGSAGDGSDYRTQGGGRGSKEGGVQMLDICKGWGDPQSSLRGETMGGKERGEGE